MKNNLICLALMGTAIISCGKKPTNTPDKAPTKNTQASKLEAPDELKGDWQHYEVNPTTKKCTVITMKLGAFLEMRETVYNDEFCQIIESTKERVLVTDYNLEMEGIRATLTLRGRKLRFFTKDLAKEANKVALCSFKDWNETETRNIEGLSCDGLPVAKKDDVSTVIVTKKDEDLLFGDLVFSRKPVETPEANVKVAEVKNPTSSELREEIESGKQVMLVYPPKTEKFLVEVPFPADQGYFRTCAPVVNTYVTSINNSERIHRMKAELDRIKALSETTNSEIAMMTQNLATYTEENKLGVYDALYHEYDENAAAMEKAFEEQRNCSEDCRSLSQRIYELKKQKNDILSRMYKTGLPTKLINGYDKMKTAIEKKEGYLENLRAQEAQQEQVVKEAEEKHFRIFENVGLDKGAKGTIHFESHWARNLRTLIKLNPKIKFRLADVDKVVMTYRLLGVDSYHANTSILDLPVAGSRSVVRGKFAMDSFPQNFSGTVELTLLASCPAFQPDAFGLTPVKTGVLEFEASFNYK